MILLEPAKHDLHNSLEDQAADHLINGVLRNYDPIKRELAENPGGLNRSVQHHLI
jgi:hypothetical protein